MFFRLTIRYEPLHNVEKKLCCSFFFFIFSPFCFAPTPHDETCRADYFFLPLPLLCFSWQLLKKKLSKTRLVMNQKQFENNSLRFFLFFLFFFCVLLLKGKQLALMIFVEMKNNCFSLRRRRKKKRETRENYL